MIEVNFDKITKLSKQERYSEVLSQVEALLKDENNLIANLSNVVSLLKYSFDYYLWVGFYFYDAERNNLVLGPFQGRIACTRIEIGKGVCGTAFKNGETLVVNDVNKFPGHIFCDSSSKSEIVVPVFRNDKIVGVLDVDSAVYSSFDDVDRKYLNELSLIISRIF
ncbi:MAG: GAF domain-containing protein [Ignavibacteria bacterium]